MSELVSTALKEETDPLVIVNNFNRSDLRPVSIIMGGAAVNRQIADSIGAQGYARDAVGAVKLVKKIVRECEREKSSTTRRYNPGYQDFPLKAQSVFLEMIGSNIPDLNLTPAGLMKPEKTITVLKGVIQEE